MKQTREVATSPSVPFPSYSELTDLCDLFIREEAMAERIADDSNTFSLAEIDEISEIARQVAFTGFPLKLVSTDEMLDIAQIFRFRDPQIARRIQDQVLEDPHHLGFDSTQAILDYRTYLVNPNEYFAGSVLLDLLPSLTDQGNSAWTTRVIATLVYFGSRKTSLY